LPEHPTTVPEAPLGDRGSRPWAPGPQRPLLADGAVHVWCADLGRVTQELCSLLSKQERERAQRILGARERRMWERSHAVLRELLGRYQPLHPARLRFTLDAHGKPRLLPAGRDHRAATRGTPSVRPASAAAGIHFNMSHSGATALYAIASGVAVGVDVEARTHGRLDELSIAARAIGPATARRLRTLTGDSRTRAFLRAWTREEAELKCLGTGIWAEAPRAPRALWGTELLCGPGVAGALALQSAPRELRCWEWAA